MAKLQPTEWIWRDGEFIAWQDANVHVLSHSMQFGSSVFEGIRCYATQGGPAIFRLEDHLQRMMNSCKIYRMDVPYTVDELVAASCELVEKNGLDSCYVRPMVLRGYGAAGMVPFDSPVEIFIPCWPWGAYLGDHAMENGADACVSSWSRMAPNTTPSMAKVAGNYLGGQLIKMEALANGYDEAIALGPDGLISEGSGQNVFVVQKGVIYTTPANGTLLPGITRDSIMTLARDAGMDVREQPLQRDVLYTADEIFLTGTASEVTPVRSVDKIKVGIGRTGEVTKLLQRTFMDLVQGRSEDRHNWLCHVRAERAAAK